MTLPGQLHELKNCPDLFDLAEYNPERYPYLLENTGESGTLGRYDILFAFPGTRITSLADGRLQINDKITAERSFLEQLETICKQQENNSDLARQHNLPFAGGWFIYLGYEMAAEIEPVLKTSLHQPLLPRATLTEIPAGIIRDRQECKDYLFATGVEEKAISREILQDIHQVLHNATPTGTDSSLTSCRLIEENGEKFLENVSRIKEYICNGDVFQVNLSRRWQAECTSKTSAAHAWRRLRKTNPAPFAAWAKIDNTTTLLSSSPERLIECRQGIVQTRPIAGTSPRSADTQLDRELSADLLIHPKEQAEHIMLVDLERNDLGRICEPGSISVDDLMVLESYAHVHHIVSAVSGRLNRNTSPADIIRAVFPGGTITGCPKVRCMEIIAELEEEARDAYTGSLGYICYNGDMDLNILIRTLTHQNGSFSFRAGAGIVADSDPVRELNETRSKARGLNKVFE